MLGGFALAQTTQTQKPAAPAPPQGAQRAAVGKLTQRCSAAGGFCLQVPEAWQDMGEVFEGAGFVVAEPSRNRPKENWNNITAAAVELPEPEAGKERPALEELVDVVLGSPAEGTTMETVRRSREMIADMPAEIVQIRLRSKTSEWMEQVALLDADEIVYSVAMGCAPGDVARLQPVFDRVLRSWKPAPPPTGAAPKQAPDGQRR